MMRLKRLSNKPILSPNPSHAWEAGAVFNCAAVFHDGLIHMIYRATNRSSKGTDGVYINALGYAVSEDGIHFNRLVDPVFEGEGKQEARGPEDPRIVRLEDRWYMMYTGYSGTDFRICMASSENLISWKRHGVVLDEQNKDASLFPEKINGRYVMFHRRPPDVWIAWSDDLVSWTDHTMVMSPIPASSWEDDKIGIGGPPIRTGQGWLLIYHGKNMSNRYSLGAVLLDLNNPSKVLARQEQPILEPELPWEREGFVPNVVFSCGQVEIDDRIIVYYGGADTVVGAAEIHRSDLSFET